MSGYQVTLLGIPSVFNKGEVVHFPYRKAEGIFYYLCVEKKTNRDELISVFWGSCDEATGRKNLRQAIFQIRRCMGKDVILQHGKNDLKLNLKSEIRTDWDVSDVEFSFYKERFLDFFYVKNCQDFEEWVENKRQIQISRNLEYIKTQLKDPSVCRASKLRRLIDTWKYWKPWDEDMVLTGMRCYAQVEQYDLGIQLYHDYAKCLRTCLDEKPSHAVELLFRTLFHRKKVSLRRKKNHNDHFFGRLKELQYIDEQIFWFLSNEPSKSIIIEGEVGVGKSALMKQIFEMNRDMGVLELVSHCYSAESKVPLRAWRDCFNQLEDLLNTRKISLTESSTKVIPLVQMGVVSENTETVCGGNEEHFSYIELENEILNLMKELAGQWKIILYIDSLHWMDTFSRRLLQRIMIELGNRQIFMVATCRISEAQDIRGLLVALNERHITTTLPLLCFTDKETEEIMKDVLRDRRDVGINAHEIFLRTDGNPLVLMDTLNMIRQEGWKEGSPLPRINMLIQLQLEKLTKKQRKVLDALSIHLKHADLEDLELLVEMDRMELIEVLERLVLNRFVTEQILRDNIIYKFRHQFYKDYVYQHLSMGKRRLWHHAVAEFYEKQKDGERWQVLLPFTVRHYEYGGDVERANVLRNCQNDI
ncbi:DNA-binding transcriptional activator of the SARP family [Dethiosulfatibacter aminovorans DSM 17477]|uniref:DNA-binding transcriptional activator of the SARP family n=1 Tax=Dethiosulfatibacter aminovorans DSM 17477 TaxID=1121476 RepID=A0A1M6I8K3_9FIRM|nr:AAA family ATPase [Dethiosulfatibacter aminovorans]SHJ30713.1 DNA-binding transcriptional activator of the SARP family [Dethiosulfatibacter aminovorans DSM 17477]